MSKEKDTARKAKKEELRIRDKINQLEIERTTACNSLRNELENAIRSATIETTEAYKKMTLSVSGKDRRVCADALEAELEAKKTVLRADCDAAIRKITAEYTEKLNALPKLASVEE